MNADAQHNTCEAPQEVPQRSGVRMPRAYMDNPEWLVEAAGAEAQGWTTIRVMRSEAGSRRSAASFYFTYRDPDGQIFRSRACVLAALQPAQAAPSAKKRPRRNTKRWGSAAAEDIDSDEKQAASPRAMGRDLRAKVKGKTAKSPTAPTPPPPPAKPAQVPRPAPKARGGAQDGGHAAEGTPQKADTGMGAAAGGGPAFHPGDAAAMDVDAGSAVIDDDDQQQPRNWPTDVEFMSQCVCALPSDSAAWALLRVTQAHALLKNVEIKPAAAGELAVGAAGVSALFATRALRSEHVIGEFAGVFTTQAGPPGAPHMYPLRETATASGAALFLDARAAGNELRFIRSGAVNNCKFLELRRARGNGATELVVCVITTMTIAVGDELLADYGP
jgi:hypothetical protein